MNSSGRAFGVARARLTACASRLGCEARAPLRELSRAACLGDPAYRLLVAPVHSSAAHDTTYGDVQPWEFPAIRRAEDSRTSFARPGCQAQSEPRWPRGCRTAEVHDAKIAVMTCLALSTNRPHDRCASASSSGRHGTWTRYTVGSTRFSAPLAHVHVGNNSY